MGFAVGDIARSPGDFKQIVELVQRLEPGATMAPIGQRGNTTYIARDEDNRDHIVAIIHVEQALEVRHLLVEPDFQYKSASFTLLHRCMEMNMRVNGVERYFFSAAKENERAIDIFKRDGAQVVDGGSIRFLKVL